MDVKLVGWVEILVILFVLACLVAVVGLAIGLAIYFSRRQRPAQAAPSLGEWPPAQRQPPVMDQTHHCPRCGAVLPANAPQALCPRCVLAVGLEPTDASPAQPEGSAKTARPNLPACEELAAHFPRFEILELLGQGGMGAVYKAKQRELDRVVALKILPPQIVSADPAFARRFASEARALAKINHPNIVAVHEFGQSGPYYFLVMEFVDGLNLRQTLAAQKLHPREALAIVPQICEALQYAHDHGVVHRDIKPENILLDRSGRVKIADFGLARLIGVDPQTQRLTASRDVMGTPHYMAPEQVENPLTVDHRADIYSLGVVFYEMLTGELPLGRFLPPSQKVQVDVRLDEVVLRALAKEPERRYQQAGEVKTDVEKLGSASAPAGATTQGALPGEERLLAQKQLKAPALGLVIASVAGPFMVGFLVAIGRLEAGAWMLWPFILQLAATVLAAYGGLKAMRLESYRLAFAGGIAGCALSFLNLFCLPFAVWLLAVLTRPHVKRTFAGGVAVDL